MQAVRIDHEAPMDTIKPIGVASVKNSRLQAKMNRLAELKYILLLLFLPVAGCSFGRHGLYPDAKMSTARVTEPSLAIITKEPGVIADFQHVTDYASVRRSLIEENSASQSITLNLDESVCLAAQHAPLARVIVDERRSIACRLGPENRSRTVEVFLDAQALEQRNKAAGNAGELFLRLVEIQLQRQLLDESDRKLREYYDTLSNAEASGLATANARGQLDALAIELKRKRSDLEIAEPEVIIKLSALIGINDVCDVLLQPSHELVPQDAKLDLQEEIAVALAQRPGLRALQDILDQGADIHLDTLLSQLAPAVGMDLHKPLKKRILQRRASNTADGSSGIRIQQVQQILAARSQQVRIEVAQSVLNIQNNLQQIALAAEDLQRLDSEMKLAESKSEIDAKESFIETIGIWSDQQKVRSNRISAAIRLEIAQVRLLEAQGQLASQCGFQLQISCPCNCQ
jgi:hypothetical protein